MRLSEACIRRQLKAEGYSLKKTPAKSRERQFYDPGYQIALDHQNVIVAGCGTRQFEMTLEDCASFLEAL